MSVKDPLFSILIANFNNGLYLESCIKSISEQTYPNIEIVCLDDGSTDRSMDILHTLSKSHINLKVYQNSENRGCGYTKHRLCDLAEGALLAFVDPEDTIVPEAVKIMVQEHGKHEDHALIYSTHYICNEYLEPSGVSPHPQAIPEDSNLLDFKDGCISHFSTFKKKSYLKTSGINPQLKKAVDQDLYYKLEEVGRVKFIDLPLYNYRIHKGGISTGSNSKNAYIWHLQTKIAAFQRRSQKVQYFRHKAILNKLQHRYVRMSFYTFMYFTLKVL